MLLAALIIATYTDIKRREIPLWVFPSISVIYIIFGFKSINWADSLFAFAIALLSYTMLAVFFGGGGGDIIMMCCIGIIVGTQKFTIIVLVSSFLCFLYRLKTKKDIIPYAPFVLAAYLILPLRDVIIWLR